MRVLLAAALLALLVAVTAQRSPDLPDYDLGELQPGNWESQAEEEYDQDEERGERMVGEGQSDEGRAQSRSGAITEKNKSTSSQSTSSSSKVTTTKVNVKATKEVATKPVVQKEVQPVVKNVVQKVTQPAVQKVVAQPVVQQVPVQPVIHNVVEKIPQPAVEKVHKVFQMPLVNTMIQKPVLEKVHHQAMIHSVQPQFSQKHLVQQLGVPQNHIDILPMSSGQYAVAVDDSRGSLVNYLSLDKQIHLVPQEIQGVNQYLLPARDLVTHKQSLVHLGSPNGHLVLSDLNVGGQLIHGFQGWDNSGQVMVPVHGEGPQMVVEPTAHRINLGSSATSSFASAGSHFPSPGGSFSFVHA